MDNTAEESVPSRDARMGNTAEESVPSRDARMGNTAEDTVELGRGENSVASVAADGR
ncbi:hypothetical protein [Salinirubrum litoreum]|uniref:Uncharacterized protein n=1 Tax=Salinirubrum litoreum TaxID=1126234 RepID=A0ABD5RCB0_9EURY|nr:hypothetical protein [Salinirubrum litoreum]